MQGGRRKDTRANETKARTSEVRKKHGRENKMKIWKATLPSLWRLTRATSMVVGLAVMLALVAGVTSLAVAKTPSGGETASAVLKGVSNTATAVTTLINSGTGPALSLRVQQGNPPLAVNSSTKVANLNADSLDGEDAAAFVRTNGKAADSDLLDGRDSTAFLGANDKAADSDLLDGQDSTAFLGANAKAADSDKLDGKDSSDFASASASKAFFNKNSSTTDGLVVQKGLEAGNYVIFGNVTATAHSEDGDDLFSFSCDIKLNNEPIAGTSGTPGSYTDFHFNGNTSMSMTTARPAANGDTLSLSCSHFYDEDGTEDVHRVSYSGELTAIRVGSIG